MATLVRSPKLATREAAAAWGCSLLLTWVRQGQGSRRRWSPASIHAPQLSRGCSITGCRRRSLCLFLTDVTPFLPQIEILAIGFMSTCSVAGASGFLVLEDKCEKETICTILKKKSPRIYLGRLKMLSEKGSKEYLYLSELYNIIIVQNRRRTNILSWLYFDFSLSVFLVSICPRITNFWCFPALYCSAKDFC